MASEFDNEIDFLLRQAVRRNSFAPDAAAEETFHLDADDLTAFAENVLPSTARLSFISHLADCNSCRETLSNLILLNEVADEEAMSVIEPEKTVTSAKWLDLLKKSFALPTLGFATAALAVLFIGVFAFIALRPTEVNQSVELVQTAAQPIETPTKKRSAASATEQKDAETESKPEESPTETPDPNANISVESASEQTTELAENLPPSVRMTRGENSANRTVAPPETTVARSNSAASNSAANVAATRQPQPETTVANGAAAARANKAENSDGATSGLPAPLESIDKAKDRLLARSSNNQDQDLESADSQESTNAPLSPASKSRSAEAGEDIRRALRKPAETRTVNGKAFLKIGGIWTDAAYNSQNVTNVFRSSDEYKKLDGGLRSIAEKLSGEIIVVWQNKAYKIR